MQVRRFRRHRREHLIVVSLVDDAAQWQHERGRHGHQTDWVIESPLKSVARLQAPLQVTMAMEDVGATVTDACVWETRRLYTGELIKQPAMVIGTVAVVSAVDLQ